MTENQAGGVMTEPKEIIPLIENWIWFYRDHSEGIDQPTAFRAHPTLIQGYMTYLALAAPLIHRCLEREGRVMVRGADVTPDESLPLTTVVLVGHKGVEHTRDLAQKRPPQPR